MKKFYESYNLKNVIKILTCYKNSDNPGCIDLILTSKPRNFQNLSVIGTSPSDFQKIAVT